MDKKPLRRIISQILHDLQKDVSGATRERLFRLYKELGLHQDAFQKLESWRWETIAQGIYELAQMEVDESYQIIRKFINDRRGVVRKQAELATVSLRDNGIDYLLDTTRHSISEWQQLKLIETLSQRIDYRPPEFKRWLLSQNKDVVLFALRLIKHYNQKGAELSIGQLVKHKNNEVRIAAIKCIVDFNFTSALPVLKKVFSKSSNRVKINILNAIATLGTEKDIPFLKQVSTSERSFVIVGKAQSSINTIAPESILPSKDIIHFNEGDNENSIDTPQKNEQVDFDKESVLQEESNVNSTYIEVDDIELYDEVDFNKQPQVDSSAEKESNAFELKPVEEELGNSIDYLLGVVKADGEPTDDISFLELYDTNSHIERLKFIEMLAESAGEEELPLLEHITENESDSELRFHAFKKVQSLKGQERPLDKQNLVNSDGQDEFGLVEQSIFYPLYHYTDDHDAKRILLKEMMTVGDQKDLPFANSLLSENNERTLKLVKNVIAKITSLSDGAIKTEIPKDIFENKATSLSEHQEHLKLEDATDAIEEIDERMPMELFMLYEELGIRAPENDNGDEQLFDFELSTEYFLELSNNSNVKSVHE
ncbi:MAG: HEAT repeat domain-containing protein [Croceivirga sp.]